MTNNVLLDQFSNSLQWMREAVADIPDGRFAEQFPATPNHPAWTLTHLSISNDFAAGLLGKASVCPAEWGKLAAPGSMPVADRSTYAGKDELLAKLSESHESLASAVRDARPEDLAAESPDEIKPFAATIGHVVTYMLVAHDNYHLAQLMDWRRGAGLAKP